MPWEDSLAPLIEDLGREETYPAGVWLDGDREPRKIRHILSGRVAIHDAASPTNAHIGDYGPGEWLGIRGAMHPDLPPRLCWRTLESLRCVEYPWEDVRARMNECHELRHVLEHLGRIRLYGVIMATHPLFSLLDRPMRKQLFDRAGIRLLMPGDPLIRQGGPRAHLYLLVSGKVRIVRDGVLIRHRQTGDILGEISVFGFRPSPTADVVAETLTEVIEFVDEDIMNAARGCVAFRRKLTEICQQRLFERVNDPR